MKVLDIQETTVGETTSKTGRLEDGTSVMYCHPCRRWEWDCNCGQVHSTREKVCSNCGEARNESAT